MESSNFALNQSPNYRFSESLMFFSPLNNCVLLQFLTTASFGHSFHSSWSFWRLAVRSLLSSLPHRLALMASHRCQPHSAISCRHICPLLLWPGRAHLLDYRKRTVRYPGCESLFAPPPNTSGCLESCRLGTDRSQTWRLSARLWFRFHSSWERRSG